MQYIQIITYQHLTKVFKIREKLESISFGTFISIL